MLISKIPLIQAPMIGCLAPLVIAVCEAGGLGSLACASLGPEQVREQAELIRAKTAAPFNVNFFCHKPPLENAETAAAEAAWLEKLAPYYAALGLDVSAVKKGPGRAPFDEAMCAVVEEVRPAVVSFHFGLPKPDFLARVKKTGAKVLSSATTVEEALWLETHGADAIIAQGMEAGGHRGMFLSEDIGAQPGLFALLPQVVDAVSLPVIATGAIADGRGIAAAFALGASAVQIGTAYLRTPQAGRSPLHHAAFSRARENATSLTNLYTGRPARGLVTRFMREMGPMNAAAPPFPLATRASDPLRLAAEKAGSDDFSLLWCGQAGVFARDRDAGEFTRNVWDEAKGVMAKLSPERP